jgi:N-acetylglucosaminyl-diphospho-decaprenol L-rhamnosyltransferase
VNDARLALSASTLSVDVIVVAYGRWDLTESCLRHLKAQTLPHRVILVDNGSEDGTATRAGHLSWVDVIRLDENRPYAVAANRGAQAGSADVLVTLNNDVNCRPDFLERVVRPLERGATLGSVAPLLLQPGEKLVDSLGLSADLTLAAFPRFHGLPVDSVDVDRPVVVGPAGAGAAYRRSAWEDAGGLDENIFAYWEDFEFALRLRSKGWGVAVTPNAVAVHVGSATHGWRSGWQRRHGGFGRAYVLRRYGVLRSRWGLRALATEAIVVTGDAVISRDLAALSGRIAGWRGARGLSRRPFPPPEALAAEIGFVESLRYRRGAYRHREAGAPA